MAFVVHEKNTFLGLESAEEPCQEGRRAQSVPPSFRAASVTADLKWSDSKWSDIMSESTEVPNDSSDCEDGISRSWSHGSSDGSPTSWSSTQDFELPSSCGDDIRSLFDGLFDDSTDGSPKSWNADASVCGCEPPPVTTSNRATLRRRSTALRLGAQQYDPHAGHAGRAQHCSQRAAEVNCVLRVLMSYLCSIPVVIDVAEKCTDDGKSVRYVVTLSGEGMEYAESVVTGAQQALLNAACNSQNVYVFGHARNPFTNLGLHCWGFQGQLCLATGRLCMDTVDFGRCNRWCPRTVCRRKHPQASQLTEITLEIQAAHS